MLFLLIWLSGAQKLPKKMGFLDPFGSLSLDSDYLLRENVRKWWPFGKCQGVFGIFNFLWTNLSIFYFLLGCQEAVTHLWASWKWSCTTWRSANAPAWLMIIIMTHKFVFFSSSKVLSLTHNRPPTPPARSMHQSPNQETLWGTLLDQVSSQNDHSFC